VILVPDIKLPTYLLTYIWSHVAVIFVHSRHFYLSPHWTDSTDSMCFSFFSGMSVLTLALCARLSWLPVSF